MGIRFQNPFVSGFVAYRPPVLLRESPNHGVVVDLGGVVLTHKPSNPLIKIPGSQSKYTRNPLLDTRRQQAQNHIDENQSYGDVDNWATHDTSIPSSFRYPRIRARTTTNSASIWSISRWTSAMSISSSGSKVST